MRICVLFFSTWLNSRRLTMLPFFFFFYCYQYFIIVMGQRFHPPAGGRGPHYLHPPQPRLPAAPFSKAPTSLPFSRARLLRLRLGRWLGGKTGRWAGRFCSAHACSEHRLIKPSGRPRVPDWQLVACVCKSFT